MDFWADTYWADTYWTDTYWTGAQETTPVCRIFTIEKDDAICILGSIYDEVYYEEVYYEDASSASVCRRITIEKEDAFDTLVCRQISIKKNNNIYVIQKNKR